MLAIGATSTVLAMIFTNEMLVQMDAVRNSNMTKVGARWLWVRVSQGRVSQGLVRGAPPAALCVPLLLPRVLLSRAVQCSCFCSLRAFTRLAASCHSPNARSAPLAKLSSSKAHTAHRPALSPWPAPQLFSRTTLTFIGFMIVAVGNYLMFL